MTLHKTNRREVFVQCLGIEAKRAREVESYEEMLSPVEQLVPADYQLIVR